MSAATPATVRGKPTFYGKDNEHVTQEINGEWCVFDAAKRDENGHFYGAIIAGAKSEAEALKRLRKVLK